MECRSEAIGPRIGWLPCLAWLLFVPFIPAQTQAEGQAKQASSTPLSLPVQKIGPNDLITVAVYDCPELSRTLRVGSDGGIQLPLLKQKIPAAGLLPEQLEAAVAQTLIREALVIDPVVTVTVLEYQGRPITVAGAVRNPVTFQAIGEVTLLEAIGRAGGLTAEAGPEVYVNRAPTTGSSAPESLVQRISVKGLLDAATPSLNVKLRGGDEVRVPSAGRVFVLGNVKRPGSYRLDDATETTVLKVLALAEGVLPYTAKEAYLYRMDNHTHQKIEKPVPVRQILDRKAPDVALLADDIFYIPDNRTQRATLNALERVISFGAATTSGVLVYRGIR